MNDNRAATNTWCQCHALLDLRLDVQVLADQVVTWLSNVHPVAWQLHLVKMRLSGHDGENLPLDRGRSVLDSVDHVQAEQVETSIDFITDEGLWLLDEALNLAIILGHDYTVACRVFDLGHDNSALLAMALVILDELLQWVLTNDIRVENKEEARLVVGSKVGLGELNGSGGAHWLGLQTHGDLDSVLYSQ